MQDKESYRAGAPAYWRDPDETEGRRLYRAYANYEARFVKQRSVKLLPKETPDAG